MQQAEAVVWGAVEEARVRVAVKVEGISLVRVQQGIVFAQNAVLLLSILPVNGVLTRPAQNAARRWFASKIGH